MPNRPLLDGDEVVLIDDRGRKYLKRLRAGHRMTIRATVVRSDDLIGGPEGVLTSVAEAERYMVFRPTYEEWATLRARDAEPVFPKDIGAILTHGDVRPGDAIIEVGLGSAALTVALLRMAAPGGSVTTYELRSDFTENATAAVHRLCGEDAPWRLVIGDARDGFAERGVDRVIADMPDPAAIVDAAATALRPGGTFVFYVPTVPQFSAAHERLATDPRFTGAHTVEILERGWWVRAPSVRPDHRMVAHTGFVTVARRTAVD